MHCRFLEISTASENVLESLEYYRALGFVELQSGDIWDHPYAVVSDGRVCIGLHAREFTSPALSFVLPGLAEVLGSTQPTHLDPTYSRLGDEQFHEAGFAAPGGQALMMLEARTFSPPGLPDTGSSVLGYFEGYALPCSDIEAGISCWESIGFVAIEDRREPRRQATLTSDNLNLLLVGDQSLREPALLFSSADLEERVALLQQRSFEIERIAPAGDAPAAGARLRGPEGLVLQIVPE